MLHLHGFNHQHAMTGLNFGARSDKDSHHLTGHGGRNLFDAVSGGIGAAAGAKRSRIANGYAEVLPPDDDSRLASRALLPDVIRLTTGLTTGLAAHQQRSAVILRGYEIENDLPAVEFALPRPGNPGEFHAPCLFADRDVVNHASLRASRRAVFVQVSLCLEIRPGFTAPLELCAWLPAFVAVAANKAPANAGIFCTFFPAIPEDPCTGPAQPRP